MTGPFIACFDVATICGCCDGFVGGRPRYWNWHTADAGPGRPQRLLYLWNFVNAYLTEAEPRVERIFVEAPMPIAVMVQIGAQDDTVQFLRAAVGVIELAAAAHEIPVEWWNVQAARQAVCGRRTYPKGTAKREVMKIVRTLGHEPDDDNTADAIVGWYYESALLNPRMALATAPLFQERGHVR